MSQSSRWSSIGREILFSARTELYMNLPFLDSALAALPAANGLRYTHARYRHARAVFSAVHGWRSGTRSRANVNRAYLHTLFHCLLRHPGKDTRTRCRPVGSFVRYCGRKHAGFTGLPLPAGGKDVGSAAEYLP